MKADPYNTERNVEMAQLFLITCALKKVPIHKVEELQIRAVKRGLLIGSKDMEKLITKL